MGEATINPLTLQLTIHSVFFFYGDAASNELAMQIADDIQTQWNEFSHTIFIKRNRLDLRFHIEGYYKPDLQPEEIWFNDDPKNNYFRIENYSNMDISFVDGISSNTGYFKLDNILHHSTTAAHEYGHTLGLDHPAQLDIRGAGQPGIMYPRGTICDPIFQYDASAKALAYGGTLNPFHRKVLPSDIESLPWNRLSFKNNKAVVGGFSSVYHEKH